MNSVESTESVELEKYFCKKCVFEPSISSVTCNKPACYHSARKTHVRNRIFRLSPIHASVTYQILWIHWIHWIPVPFRKNSNGSDSSLINQSVWRRKEIVTECLRLFFLWEETHTADILQNFFRLDNAALFLRSFGHVIIFRTELHARRQLAEATIYFAFYKRNGSKCQKVGSDFSQTVAAARKAKLSFSWIQSFGRTAKICLTIVMLCDFTFVTIYRDLPPRHPSPLPPPPSTN